MLLSAVFKRASVFISARNTLQPCSCSLIAIAFPIPEPAPVTMAVFLVKLSQLVDMMLVHKRLMPSQRNQRNRRKNQIISKAQCSNYSLKL